LALSEQPELQDIAGDKEFTESWQRVDPVMTLAGHPKMVAIRRNPDLLKTIWNETAPNLADLRVYLVTGQSPKFDPIKILGAWRFDVGSAVAAMRRAKPNMPSS